MTDQDFRPISSIEEVMSLDSFALERLRLAYIDKAAHTEASLASLREKGHPTSRSAYHLSHFRTVLQWIASENKRRERLKQNEPGSAKARRAEANARAAELRAEAARANAEAQRAAIEAKTKRNQELINQLWEENKALKARIAELEALTTA